MKNNFPYQRNLMTKVSLGLKGQREQLHDFILKNFSDGDNLANMYYKPKKPKYTDFKILIFNPTKNRPYYTLVTEGLSFLPMKNNKGQNKFMEIVMCLPSAWSIFSKPLSECWPLETMGRLIDYVHNYKELLWAGYNLGDSKEITTQNGLNSSKLFIGKLSYYPDDMVCKINDDVSINFFSVIPLYDEELSCLYDIYKQPNETYGSVVWYIRTKGLTELLEVGRPSFVAETEEQFERIKVSEDGQLDITSVEIAPQQDDELVNALVRRALESATAKYGKFTYDAELRDYDNRIFTFTGVYQSKPVTLRMQAFEMQAEAGFSDEDYDKAKESGLSEKDLFKCPIILFVSLSEGRATDEGRTAFLSYSKQSFNAGLEKLPEGVLYIKNYRYIYKMYDYEDILCENMEFIEGQIFVPEGMNGPEE